MAVADQDQDAGAGVAAAQTDVVQPAVVSQGDDAAELDAVVAGPGRQRPVSIGVPVGTAFGRAA